MFFLLRMAFWLGVVCVLLPSGAKTDVPAANIDATQALTLAGAAVSDMRGFCDRQPEACVTGGKVAVAIGHKAEAGARTIYDFVTAKLAEKSVARRKDCSCRQSRRQGRAGDSARHPDADGSGAGLARAGSAAAAARSPHPQSVGLTAFFDAILRALRRPPSSFLAVRPAPAYI